MNSGYELVYKEVDHKKFWKLFDSLKLNYPNIGSIYNHEILDYSYR